MLLALAPCALLMADPGIVVSCSVVVQVEGRKHWLLLPPSLLDSPTVLIHPNRSGTQCQQQNRRGGGCVGRGGEEVCHSAPIVHAWHLYDAD